MEKYIVDVEQVKYSEIMEEYRKISEALGSITSLCNGSSLSGELKTYYTNLIGAGTITKKLNGIIEAANNVSNNISQSILLISIIDEDCYGELSSILEMLFTTDTEMTEEQLMYYSSSESSKISFEDYCNALDENEEFFASERERVMNTFASQMMIATQKFKGETVPVLLNSMVESVFTIINYKEIQQGNISYDDKLREFKTTFSNKIFENTQESLETVIDTIPELYWDKTEGDKYQQALLLLAYSGNIEDNFYQTLEEIGVEADTVFEASSYSLSVIDETLELMESVITEDGSVKDYKDIIEDYSRYCSEISNLYNLLEDSAHRTVHDVCSVYGIDKFEIDRVWFETLKECGYLPENLNGYELPDIGDTESYELYLKTIGSAGYLSEIQKKYGADATAHFLETYYRKFKDQNGNQRIPDEDIEKNLVNILRDVTGLLTNKNLLDDCFATVLNPFQTLRSNMALIEKTESNVGMFLASKLEYEGVTDGQYQEAKKDLGNDAEYLEEWQIKAYAYLKAKNKERCEQFRENQLDTQVMDLKAKETAMNHVNIMIENSDDWYDHLLGLGAAYSGIVGFGYGLGNFGRGLENIFTHDGKICQSELEQMYITQYLTFDYSIYQDYGSEEYQDMISTNYENIDGITTEQEEFLKKAKENELPKYMVLYSLGMINEEEYNKYLLYSETKKEDALFYKELSENKFYREYVLNNAYQTGQSAGYMALPMLATYLPGGQLLSTLLIGASTLGSSMEQLQQSGETNEFNLWAYGLLNAALSAGVERLGGVLSNKSAFKFLDDLELPPFLRNIVDEVIEENIEMFAGYGLDAIYNKDALPKSGMEILEEMLATSFQTALSTPIIGAMGKRPNPNKMQDVKLQNGMTMTYSQSEMLQFANQDGSINYGDFSQWLIQEGRLKVNGNDATSFVNKVMGSEVVNGVRLTEKGYVVDFNDGSTMNFNLETILEEIGKKEQNEGELTNQTQETMDSSLMNLNQEQVSLLGSIFGSISANIKTMAGTTTDLTVDKLTTVNEFVTKFIDGLKTNNAKKQIDKLNGDDLVTYMDSLDANMLTKTVKGADGKEVTLLEYAWENGYVDSDFGGLYKVPEIATQNAEVAKIVLNHDDGALEDGITTFVNKLNPEMLTSEVVNTTGEKVTLLEYAWEHGYHTNGIDGTTSFEIPRSAQTNVDVAKICIDNHEKIPDFYQFMIGLDESVLTSEVVNSDGDKVDFSKYAWQTVDASDRIITDNFDTTCLNLPYDPKTFSADDVMLVRSTDIFPHNHTIQSLYSTIKSETANSQHYDWNQSPSGMAASQGAMSEMMYRQTNHFSANGLVAEVEGNDWKNKPFIILEPLKYHVEGERVRGSAVDLYYNHDIKLSDEAVIMVRKDYYDANKDSIPSGYNIVLFEGENTTNCVNSLLYKMGYKPQEMSKNLSGGVSNPNNTTENNRYIINEYLNNNAADYEFGNHWNGPTDPTSYDAYFEYYYTNKHNTYNELHNEPIDMNQNIALTEGDFLYMFANDKHNDNYQGALSPERVKEIMLQSGYRYDAATNQFYSIDYNEFMQRNDANVKGELNDDEFTTVFHIINAHLSENSTQADVVQPQDNLPDTSEVTMDTESNSNNSGDVNLATETIGDESVTLKEKPTLNKHDGEFKEIAIDTFMDATLETSEETTSVDDTNSSSEIIEELDLEEVSEEEKYERMASEGDFSFLRGSPKEVWLKYLDQAVKAGASVSTQSMAWFDPDIAQIYANNGDFGFLGHATPDILKMFLDQAYKSGEKPFYNFLIHPATNNLELAQICVNNGDYQFLQRADESIVKALLPSLYEQGVELNISSAKDNVEIARICANHGDYSFLDGATPAVIQEFLAEVYEKGVAVGYDAVYDLAGRNTELAQICAEHGDYRFLEYAILPVAKKFITEAYEKGIDINPDTIYWASYDAEVARICAEHDDYRFLSSANSAITKQFLAEAYDKGVDFNRDKVHQLAAYDAGIAQICIVHGDYKVLNEVKLNSNDMGQLVATIEKSNPQTVVDAVRENSQLLQYLSPQILSEYAFEIRSIVMGEIYLNNNTDLDFLNFVKQHYPEYSDYVNQAIAKPTVVGVMYNLFTQIRDGKNYGVNQGGLKDFSKSDLPDWATQNIPFISSLLLKNELMNGKDATRLQSKLILEGFTPVDARVILDTVDSVGACSYAAMCNTIFQIYYNKPDEFQKTFGYPMYTVQDGKVGLNSNELLLDLYVWANTKGNGGSLILDNHTLNPDALKTGEYMLDAKNQEYMSSSATGLKEEKLNGFLASKGADSNYQVNLIHNSSTITNAELANLKNEVSNALSNGLPIEMGVSGGTRIFTFDNTNNSVFMTIPQNEGHAVFITGMTETGFIVSSWGGEYLIPFSELKHSLVDISVVSPVDTN